MQNQSSTFPFTWLAFANCAAFAGLGLLALKLPSPWMLLIVDLTVVFVVAYALVSVLVVSTGSRQKLFWAAFFAAFVASSLLLESPYSSRLPYVFVKWLLMLLHPSPSKLAGGESEYFFIIAGRLFVVMISTAAAYIIPWLVQRGQKPQEA